MAYQNTPRSKALHELTWTGVTKRQRACLEYIEVLNKWGPSSLRHQYTYGPAGRRVKVLDMRVVRPLVRKGLVVLLYPQLHEDLDSTFYPILTTKGKKVVDRDL